MPYLLRQALGHQIAAVFRYCPFRSGGESVQPLSPKIRQLCVNSLGNGVIEDESVVIRPKTASAALANTSNRLRSPMSAFYQRLDPPIQVIGTGGVYSGRDAFEHILCGASMVQIGTALHQQGVDIFKRFPAI